MAPPTAMVRASDEILWVVRMVNRKFVGVGVSLTSLPLSRQVDSGVQHGVEERCITESFLCLGVSVVLDTIG